MNNEEGARALDKAKRAIANGNIIEGLKYLKISQRLAPSREASTLIEQYSPSPAHSSSSSSSTPSHPSAVSANSISQVMNILQDVLRRGYHHYLQFENKYIVPSMRQFIRGLFAIICFLIVIKYVFKQKIGFGQLPGDISYNSPNMFISAPLVSCLLASFLFNGLLRAFQP